MRRQAPRGGSKIAPVADNPRRVATEKGIDASKGLRIAYPDQRGLVSRSVCVEAGAVNTDERPKVEQGGGIDHYPPPCCVLAVRVGS